MNLSIKFKREIKKRVLKSMPSIAIILMLIVGVKYSTISHIMEDGQEVSNVEKLNFIMKTTDLSHYINFKNVKLKDYLKF